MTQGQSQVNLLSIRKFAAACHTTPRTLRLYEKIGLFKPSYIDPYNKYRYYDQKQRKDFLQIKLLQNFHVPLKQIRISKLKANDFLQGKLSELKKELNERKKERRFLISIKKFLIDDEDVRKHLRIETFGPYLLFCKRVEHAKYNQISKYITSLWKEAKRLKLPCIKSEITFYLNRAFDPKNIRLEIALICKKTDSGMKPNVIPKNHYFKIYTKRKVLTYDYAGPYSYLALVYQKINDYIQNEKIKITDEIFEKYMKGPLNSNSKYDYLTKIGYPILGGGGGRL